MEPKSKTLTDNLPLNSYCDLLYYQLNEKWILVPEWVKFFLKLGTHLSMFDFGDLHYRIALALPCRRFASSLVTSGITCGRSAITIKESDHEYYQKIISLAEGTPLIYRHGKRKKNALKRENISYQGNIHIGVQVDEGAKTTIFVAPWDVRRIEVSKKFCRGLPNQQKGREIPPPSKLLENIVGETHVYDYIFQTRLDFIVVGSKSLLREEYFQNFNLRISKDSESEGNLVDLSRIQDFQSPGNAYRGVIFQATSNDNSSLKNETPPFVVVFDGANGFIKWKDSFRNSNWIILLDRTDLNFDSAVTYVNQEHLMRSEKTPKLIIPNLPPSVEAMFFTAGI